MLTLAFLSLLEYFEIYSASLLIPLAYPLFSSLKAMKTWMHARENALHLVHAKKIPEDKHP